MSGMSSVIIPPFRGARVSMTANQAIPNITNTNLIFGQADRDSENIWKGAAPTRLTVPVGVTEIRLLANIDWQNNAVGKRLCDVLKNGALFAGGFTFDVGAPDSVFRENGTSSLLVVTGGDYFELQVYQNAGGAVNVTASGQTWFAMEVIR